jgi:hypothetical protein
MKHLKLFENQTKTYWIIKDPGTNYYDDVTYLFDNEKDLLNFTLNEVYNTIRKEFDKDNDEETLEKLYSELDDCDNAESVLEILNDAIDNELLGDHDTKLTIETTSLDENIHLENWIELRRNAKKYNL